MRARTVSLPHSVTYCSLVAVVILRETNWPAISALVMMLVFAISMLSYHSILAIVVQYLELTWPMLQQKF